jgi:putative addiction module component (TIGR02574 family)
MAIRPELRDELLKLPADERHELANELYESLDDEPVDPAWERAWSSEIMRRVQEVADGTVRLVDADHMHAQLRAELQGFPRTRDPSPATR